MEFKNRSGCLALAQPEAITRVSATTDVEMAQINQHIDLISGQ